MIIGIAYDLYRKSGHHYARLIHCIRSNYECIFHQKSMWFISTDESVDEVQRRLGIFVDARDKLAVFEANQGDVDRFLV